ncbi:MAG: hypothetical protein IJZ30_04720 [Alphaproteobacteria bacterium]|nr:hypothetical protein [Alphaproteobacteria bacterium]
MKKIVATLFICLTVFLLPTNANADLINVSTVKFDVYSGGEAMNNLSNKVTSLAKTIHTASSKMLKFANMLYCNSLHGKAADWEIEIPALNWSKSWRLISFPLWFSAIILIFVGFLITVATSFYLFDIAFNLSITIVLLPLGIALWPFGWTKAKLKNIVNNIVYYTGLFIFLPLGITIANQLVSTVIANVFGGEQALIEAFENDQADIIKDNLSLFTLSFLKVLISYCVAFKIIPLMATEFCGRFFGGALAGNPISEKITQMIAKFHRKTTKPLAKYGKDVAKHQSGNLLKKMGNEKGNFAQRALYRAGASLGKTK